MFLNIYYWKNWRSQNLSEKYISRKKQFEEMHELLKSNKVQSIFEKTFILALLSLAVFRLQNRVSDFF